ncbi:hypothetical protein T08_8098 [Trichinella sp. T8]|nr:hypothetical protein T08_8098 [Trichinella sp. T8]
MCISKQNYFIIARCYYCVGTRGCPGKLYTNLDATQVMRTGEHAEGCRVDAHAFYHQQQLNELKRLAAEDQSIACNLSACSQSQKGGGVWIDCKVNRIAPLFYNCLALVIKVQNDSRIVISSVILPLKHNPKTGQKTKNLWSAETISDSKLAKT